MRNNSPFRSIRSSCQTWLPPSGIVNRCDLGNGVPPHCDPGGRRGQTPHEGGETRRLPRRDEPGPPAERGGARAIISPRFMPRRLARLRQSSESTLRWRRAASLLGRMAELTGELVHVGETGLPLALDLTHDRAALSRSSDFGQAREELAESDVVIFVRRVDRER